MFLKTNRYKVIGLASLACLGLFHQSAFALETVSTSDSKNVSITIYNDHFGVVKDTREVELKEGLNYISFEDVASGIEPTSVKFRSLSAPNEVVIREQNYRYDLLEPASILYKSMGKTATFKQTLAGGQVNEFNGKIIYAPSPGSGGGMVVQSGDQVILNPEGQVSLAALPPDMFSRPSLLWTIASEKSGKHRCEVSYQTGGMTWHADYVATINDGDNKADLNSWVTVENESGASYKQASLKLMAGEVHVAPVPAPLGKRFAAAKVDRSGAGEAPFEEHAFSEYHLYTLNGKTDLDDQETKQITLFQAAEIPVTKRFIFDWGGNGYYPNNRPDGIKQNAEVKIEIDNTKENHLGMPIPAGSVRVMKADKDGALEFIGGDSIQHTAKDEKIRILIGRAFDVVGTYKQMSDERSSHNRKMSYQIDLSNHKDSDIVCTVVEHAMGDWKINAHSMPFVKKNSGTFEFAVPIKANSTATITYEVETHF